MLVEWSKEIRIKTRLKRVFFINRELLLSFVYNNLFLISNQFVVFPFYNLKINTFYLNIFKVKISNHHQENSYFLTLNIIFNIIILFELTCSENTIFLFSKPNINYIWLWYFKSERLFCWLKFDVILVTFCVVYIHPILCIHQITFLFI